MQVALNQHLKCSTHVRPYEAGHTRVEAGSWLAKQFIGGQWPCVYKTAAQRQGLL